MYEDKDIIVCHKPSGIATQTSRVGQVDMVSEIAGYLASGQRKSDLPGDPASGRKDSISAGNDRQAEGTPYVGLVHRLDQPVEGILVFARNKAAASVLSRQAAAGQMEKEYYAVVCGQDIPESGELVDYLLKEGRTNLSRVVPKEVKEAKEARLRFRILQRKAAELPGGESRQLALAKIRLETGRHHQIRVQMANAGLSLLGDHKYADAAAVRLSEQMGLKEIALCACRLSFAHPGTREKMMFQTRPGGKGFGAFREDIDEDMESYAAQI